MKQKEKLADEAIPFPFPDVITGDQLPVAMSRRIQGAAKAVVPDATEELQRSATTQDDPTYLHFVYRMALGVTSGSAERAFKIASGQLTARMGLTALDMVKHGVGPSVALQAAFGLPLHLALRAFEASEQERNTLHDAFAQVGAIRRRAGLVTQVRVLTPELFARWMFEHDLGEGQYDEVIRKLGNGSSVDRRASAFDGLWKEFGDELIDEARHYFAWTPRDEWPDSVLLRARSEGFTIPSMPEDNEVKPR